MAHAESYLCRADRRLMAARTQGDAQAVECLSARGRELRATYRTLTDTQDEQIRRAAEASLAHKLDMLGDCETGPRRAPDSVRVLAPVLADLEDAPGRGWTAQ